MTPETESALLALVRILATSTPDHARIIAARDQLNTALAAPAPDLLRLVARLVAITPGYATLPAIEHLRAEIGRALARLEAPPAPPQPRPVALLQKRPRSALDEDTVRAMRGAGL